MNTSTIILIVVVSIIGLLIVIGIIAGIAIYLKNSKKTGKNKGLTITKAQNGPPLPTDT